MDTALKALAEPRRREILKLVWTAELPAAEIALALGRTGVNIADMALSPSEDNSQGVISLWIRGDGPSARAERLIAELGHPVAPA